MKAILSLILPVFFYLGCTKADGINAQDCVLVTVYSDKYTADTAFLKTDVLYSACLNGINLERCRNAGDSWFLMCDPSLPFSLEHIRYQIGDKKTYPYIKK